MYLSFWVATVEYPVSNIVQWSTSKVHDQLNDEFNILTFTWIMSSQHILLQSDVESNSSEVESKAELLNHKQMNDEARKLILQAEAKV